MRMNTGKGKHGIFAHTFAQEPSVFDAAAKIEQPDWEKVFDDNSGLYYYYNFATGESQWEPPAGFEDPDAEDEDYFYSGTGATDGYTDDPYNPDEYMVEPASNWMKVWEEKYQEYVSHLSPENPPTSAALSSTLFTPNPTTPSTTLTQSLVNPLGRGRQIFDQL